jgi:hypothetical protein
MALQRRHFAWPPQRPEPLNRGLQVTDKRPGAWQKRAILKKKGSFEVSLS